MYQVKIRFADHFSVHDKVRLDIAERPFTVLETTADGSLLLTDRVCGLQELRHWLRQFGASAEVLESRELREMMLDSAMRRFLPKAGCKITAKEICSSYQVRKNAELYSHYYVQHI